MVVMSCCLLSYVGCIVFSLSWLWWPVCSLLLFSLSLCLSSFLQIHELNKRMSAIECMLNRLEEKILVRSDEVTRQSWGCAGPLCI